MPGHRNAGETKKQPDQTLPPANRADDESMERGDLAMSPVMKLVFWFVAANALIGAGSLIRFSGDTSRLFF